MTPEAAACNRHQTQYTKNGSHKLSSIKKCGTFFLLEKLNNTTKDLSLCENKDTE
jgi:hypothetical protein